MPLLAPIHTVSSDFLGLDTEKYAPEFRRILRTDFHRCQDSLMEHYLFRSCTSWDDERDVVRATLIDKIGEQINNAFVEDWVAAIQYDEFSVEQRAIVDWDMRLAEYKKATSSPGWAGAPAIVRRTHTEQDIADARKEPGWDESWIVKYFTDETKAAYAVRLRDAVDQHFESIEQKKVLTAKRVAKDAWCDELNPRAFIAPEEYYRLCQLVKAPGGALVMDSYINQRLAGIPTSDVQTLIILGEVFEQLRGIHYEEIEVRKIFSYSAPHQGYLDSVFRLYRNKQWVPDGGDPLGEDRSCKQYDLWTRLETNDEYDARLALSIEYSVRRREREQEWKDAHTPAARDARHHAKLEHLAQLRARDAEECAVWYAEEAAKKQAEEDTKKQAEEDTKKQAEEAAKKQARDTKKQAEEDTKKQARDTRQSVLASQRLPKALQRHETAQTYLAVLKRANDALRAKTGGLVTGPQSLKLANQEKAIVNAMLAVTRTGQLVDELNILL